MKNKFCCSFCNENYFKIRFKYNFPPIGETKFKLNNQNYKRHYISCNFCGHWFSKHNIDLKYFYTNYAPLTLQ